MEAIRAEGLTRRFGDRVAVNDMSFAVERGEIVGLLGPNGAGKSTAIKMLTCQLRPTVGTAWVLGCDVRRDQGRIKPRIGVVFEGQNVYERMSGRENLEFAARLYDSDRRRVEEVLDLVGLTKRAGDRVAHYSNGMRQRLLIARALLPRPQVLFLDEPTRGLDPSSAREIRALVADMGKMNATVLLATHDMEEADHLCRRVAIIDRGHIVAMEAPRALKLAYGRPEARVLRRDGVEEILSLGRSLETQRLAELVLAGDVRAIHSQEATLEEAFLALTGRSLVE